MAAMEPSAYDYTKIVEQTTVVIVDAVETVSVVRTTVEVADVPPAVAITVAVPFDGVLPSHSTCPLFCPRENHMHDNPYLHSQQTDKICSINWSDS